MAYAAPDGTELVEALGVGTVFDVALVREGDRTFVAKRLSTRMRGEPAARAAIVREAKLLAAVKHASLPSLVRVGADAAGPFLVETRAEGVSLRDLVDAWRFGGDAIPPTLVVHLAVSATKALAELHSLADDRGPLDFVHGDLGPDHVLLGPLGQVRFVDFGAARFRDDDGPSENRGTLPFVAPEVARGDAVATAATDVYALAATIVHLAIGRPLTASRNDAAMLLEIGERGLDPSLVDAAHCFSKSGRDALANALELDPAKRSKRSIDLACALAR
jgi:serine/threonine protein kinase